MEDLARTTVAHRHGRRLSVSYSLARILKFQNHVKPTSALELTASEAVCLHSCATNRKYGGRERKQVEAAGDLRLECAAWRPIIHLLVGLSIERDTSVSALDTQSSIPFVGLSVGPENVLWQNG